MPLTHLVQTYKYERNCKISTAWYNQASWMYFISSLLLEWYSLNSQTPVLTYIHAKARAGPWSPCSCSLSLPLPRCRPRALTQPHMGSLGIGLCLLLSARQLKHFLERKTGLSQPLQLYEQFSCYFRWAVRLNQQSTPFSEISLSSLKDHKREQCTQQWNKHCVPNLKDVSIWAPSSQKTHIF